MKSKLTVENYKDLVIGCLSTSDMREACYNDIRKLNALEVVELTIEANKQYGSLGVNAVISVLKNKG